MLALSAHPASRTTSATQLEPGFRFFGNSIRPLLFGCGSFPVFYRSHAGALPATPAPASSSELIICGARNPSRGWASEPGAETSPHRSRLRGPPAGWVSGAGSGAVMSPHRLLDLKQNFRPLRAGLPLPEHHKTLTTDTAMELGVPVCLSAQHLHLIPH